MDRQIIESLIRFFKHLWQVSKKLATTEGKFCKNSLSLDFPTFHIEYEFLLIDSPLLNSSHRKFFFNLTFISKIDFFWLEI